MSTQPLTEKTWCPKFDHYDHGPQAALRLFSTKCSICLDEGASLFYMRATCGKCCRIESCLSMKRRPDGVKGTLFADSVLNRFCHYLDGEGAQSAGRTSQETLMCSKRACPRSAAVLSTGYQPRNKTLVHVKLPLGICSSIYSVLQQCISAKGRFGTDDSQVI